MLYFLQYSFCGILVYFFYSALYVCTIYGAPTFFLEVQRLLKLTKLINVYEQF